MTMDSQMLSPRDGDPHDYTSISVALPFYDNASGGLTDIINVGEGSGTFGERSECFSSATIINIKILTTNIDKFSVCQQYAQDKAIHMKL